MQGAGVRRARAARRPDAVRAVGVRGPGARPVRDPRPGRESSRTPLLTASRRWAGGPGRGLSAARPCFRRSARPAEVAGDLDATRGRCSALRRCPRCCTRTIGTFSLSVNTGAVWVGNSDGGAGREEGGLECGSRLDAQIEGVHPRSRTREVLPASPAIRVPTGSVPLLPSLGRRRCRSLTRSTLRWLRLCCTECIFKVLLNYAIL